MSVSRQDLERAVAGCSQAFRRVRDIAAADEVQLSKLTSAWMSYYLEDFARFDRLLRESVDSGGHHYESLAPISISHHNLNRLMEVLRMELGEAPLARTRVPERIHDLSETVKQMSNVLEEQALPKENGRLQPSLNSRHQQSED